MTGLHDHAAANIGNPSVHGSNALQTNLRAQLPGMVLALIGLAALVGGFATLDVSWHRVAGGVSELGRIATLMLPPQFGSEARLLLWVHALVETLAIAFLGTLLAAILAFPLGFLVARNVMPSWVLRFSLRRLLDGIRGVDTLIWALIWINVVGLGPFAGVLAIMISDLGAFGKLFSEAIETVDEKSAVGVVSTGGSSLHRVMVWHHSTGAAGSPQPDPLLL
jgi:phosphonate transport system permease protein